MTQTLNDFSADKLGFGFFVAAAFHAILIFGVALNYLADADAEISNEIEVTLVTHRSEESPDQADFFAQANQQGSGTLEEKSATTTTHQSLFADSGVADVNPFPQAAGDSSSRSELEIVSTRASAELSAAQVTSETEVQEQDGNAAPFSDTNAMLARLDALQQEYARRPRIGALTSISAQAREDAEYQLLLQNRIVSIGNQYYPERSIQDGVFGELRLQLTIDHQGNVVDILLLESSGHGLLDAAALDIARKSAPFPPFSDALAAKYDQVLFIRTWSFTEGGALQTR